MKSFCLIACTILSVAFAAARADVPEMLSYQGVLTDAAGTAVPDGPYNVTFRLYTVEAGGSPIWQEAHALVVTKGIFNAMLGSTVTLGTLDFDGPYYLGISVEGEAELEPRVQLAGAAYAMNARMVKGSAATANRIPAEGHVGIGTTSPSNPLTVTGVTDHPVPLLVNGNNQHWAGIYVNAVQPAATAMYGYLREGGTRAYTGLNTEDNWFLWLNDAWRMQVTPDGNVGIGTSPLERLHINGGLRLGNTSTTAAGTLRWTGSDFEGHDGSSWRSLTATGGGDGLPPGAAGQTLRHDGSSWAATSSLYNNNAQIGIGTTDPEARLDIVGSASQDIKVETSSATGRANLTLKSTGGSFDYLELLKHGPSAGGTTAGVPIANLSRVAAGSQAGPLMLQVITANPMYFVTGNLERMRLAADGNLGINTTSPEAKLHVDGNQWDLTNTEGDFKIGSATHRLKFGVATEGAGAGTAGIRVAGGAEKLILGAGSAEVLSINSAGVTQIGGESSSADLQLYRSGVATPMLEASTTNYGGVMSIYDEAGNYIASLEPDFDGEGGYLYVTRNAAGHGAFVVDGNYLGTMEPRVSISGSARAAHFRMDQTGNASVVLPADAISAAEILDEPGVASYTSNTSTSIATTMTVLASQTINAPTAGYVLVIATCQGQVGHVSGTLTQVDFGVSNNSSTLPNNQDVLYSYPSSAASGTYATPVTCHGLFSVSAGANTFYMLGRKYSESYNAFALDKQLTAIFIPTSYGTVMPTLASDAPGDDAAPSDNGMTASEIAEARSRSIEADNARIQRELDEMRAELEAIKETLKNR